MRKGEFVFGAFRLDPANALLWRGGERVAIAPKPFEVLCALVSRPGELVTKDELLQAVWRNLHVSESSLSVAIKAVRIALGDDPRTPRFIETAPKRGFRFVAPVTALSERPDSPLSEKPDPPQSEKRDPAPAASPPGEAKAQWWVGRVAPLEAIEPTLQRVTRGERQVAFVTGEAGIGKTTFLEMLARTLESRGFFLFWARCIEQFGTDEAFLPLIEALQEHCSGPNPLVSRDILRAYAPTWLAQMTGLLDAREREALQKEVFGATRERMLREFCELVERASAQRPWAVVIEDMHWGDYATLDVLSLFAQRQQPAAVFLIVSYRPGDVMVGEHPVRTVHQELQIRDRCIEIALDRLSIGEVEKYLRLRFSDSEIAEALAEQVFKRTDGQPLFMVALIDYLVAQQDIREIDGRWRLLKGDSIARSIPRSLKTMIARQIDRLDAESQRVLEAASVFGVECSAATVAGALDMSVPQVEQICEQLARKGLILTNAGVEEWPDGAVAGVYGFQHALYQEELYQRLAPGQQINLHRRIGKRLEAAYGDRASEIAPVLAQHFEKGRDPVKAVQYLEQSAESSRKRFAVHEAEAYLTRALALVEGLPKELQAPARIRILRQRGRVRPSSSDNIRRAFADLVSVISIAAETNQPKVEIPALLDLCGYSLFSDRQLCLDAAEKALARCDGVDHRFLKALVQSLHSMVSLYLKGWTNEAASRYQEAAHILETSGDKNFESAVFGTKGTVESLCSNYRESAASAKSGQAVVRDIGDVFLYSIHSFVEAWALFHLGCWREIREQLPAKIKIMHENANSRLAQTVSLLVAYVHMEAFDYETAQRICEQWADDDADEGNLTGSFFLGRALLARAQIGLGKSDLALSHLKAIQRRVEVDGVIFDSLCRPLFHLGFAEYWFAVGDVAQARLQATKLYEFTVRAPERTYLALARRMLAKIAMRERDFAAARREIGQALATVENAELPIAAWRIYATAAELHASFGESDAAANFDAQANRCVSALAENFAADDPLRASLLSGYARERRETYEKIERGDD